MRREMACLCMVFLVGWPGLALAQKASRKKANADVGSIGQRDVTRGTWNLWSAEKEAELGYVLAMQAERTVALLEDSVVVEYVSRLTERIARNSDTRYPVQVRVIDSRELNAFALPGGFFFVHTGLLLEARTEAELAGVIAHEIAHVAARHTTRQMTRATLWNWASLPIAVLGGPAGYWVHQGLTLAVPLTFLKFSRNAEREADFLGMQYHYAAGYDPTAFVDFFERMKSLDKEKKGGIARAFSTHPMTKDRVRAAHRMMEEVLPERSAYVVNTSRHEEMQSYLRGLLGERKRRTAEEPVLRKSSVAERDEMQERKPN